MLRRLLLVFTDKELRAKLIKIGLLLLAIRFLAYIPLPFLKATEVATTLDSDTVFSILNTVSGGSYGNLSFVMLGIGPYITASIVIQLLTVIIPKLAEIQKEEGELGKQKINRWTRLLTIPLAMLNAWGILNYLSAPSNTTKVLPDGFNTGVISLESTLTWLVVILSLTAGSIIMMWIGEIITEYKMGNGISLIILSGIVVRLPNQFGQFVSNSFGNLVDAFKIIFSTPSKLGNWDVWKAFLWGNEQWVPARSLFIFFFMFIVTLLLVIFVNDAVRRLIIIYSRRGHGEGNSRTLGKVKADLPIKVNIAGVIPIIFAVSFLVFPSIVSKFMATSNIESIRNISTSISTHLSTEKSQNVSIPDNLPKNNFLGFYATQNVDEAKAAIGYDSTVGQELFGFTLSTEGGLQNSYFEGTPLSFIKFNAGNAGFLPQFTVRWNGILAYNLYYFLLIIFFTYFYTSTVVFKTDDVAENLQKSGAYIPGYKPGLETQNYLSYLSNRLNVAGSIFLAVIALIPILLSNNINFGNGSLNGIIGGTTLLILVSVTIETLRQIEAQATAVDYERFTKY